jgi:hypothetical protein
MQQSPPGDSKPRPSRCSPAKPTVDLLAFLEEEASSPLGDSQPKEDSPAAIVDSTSRPKPHERKSLAGDSKPQPTAPTTDQPKRAGLGKER